MSWAFLMRPGPLGSLTLKSLNSWPLTLTDGPLQFNTDLTLWESGAIIEYLIEKYDTENKLSFPSGSTLTYLAKQWLFFQVSGQGPYYGQSIWFTNFHSEDVPSAKERYLKEAYRVTSVLDGHLSKQPSDNGGPWLVGNKLSYVDLAFVSWQMFLDYRVPD